MMKEREKMKIIVPSNDFEIIHSSVDIIVKLKNGSPSFNFFEFIGSKLKSIPPFVLPSSIPIKEEIIFEFDDNIIRSLRSISNIIMIRGEHINGGDFSIGDPILHKASRANSLMSDIIPGIEKIIRKSKRLPTIYFEYFDKSLKIFFIFSDFDMEYYSPILDILSNLSKIVICKLWKEKDVEFIFDENSDLKIFENLVEIPFLPREEREKKIRELENFKSLMSIL